VTMSKLKRNEWRDILDALGLPLPASRRKYKIPEPEKALNTFGTKPGAKIAATKKKVEERQKLRKEKAEAKRIIEIRRLALKDPKTPSTS
jgi:hypothetical protein